MNEMFFTLTGTNHYYGTDFLKPEMEVKLEKDPKNEYDQEAIMVKMKGLGQIGNVANSFYTVKGESMSAGRLYDKIGDTAVAKVFVVIPQGAICVVTETGLEDGKATEKTTEDVILF